MKRFVLLAVCLAAVAVARGAELELLGRSGASVAAKTGNGPSMGPVFSPDGRYLLYSSLANDLTAGPLNSSFNLYMRDRTDGSVKRVSNGLLGAAANGHSEAGGMSRDNRYVVFQSTANNLSGDDITVNGQIYLKDLQADTIRLVSRNALSQAAGNAASGPAQISEDGNWVVFESRANNLGPVDTNMTSDLYAWNRVENSMQNISLGASSVADFSITADSKFVLFTAVGPNLMTRQATVASRVYLRSLEAHTNRWIGSMLTNMAGHSSTSCVSAVISRDGRYVYCMSIPSGTPVRPALVRMDLENDTAVIVSTNLVDTPAYWSRLIGPTISDDGEYAAFRVRTNIVRWSASAGTVEPVFGMTPYDTNSSLPVISHDGRFVAFTSPRELLLPEITERGTRLYVKDMQGETRVATTLPNGDASLDVNVWSAMFAPDDSQIVFTSDDSVFVDGDLNNSLDLFGWSMANETLQTVSTNASGRTAAANAPKSLSQQAVSRDGRFVAYSTFAPLNERDINLVSDVYVWDRLLKTNILASAGTNGFTSPAGSASAAMISADGRYVAFESSVVGLAGDSTRGANVYWRDLATGSLLNCSSNNSAAGAGLRGLSDDGRFVYSTAGNGVLSRADAVAGTNVYLNLGLGSGAISSVSGSGQRVVFQIGLTSYFFDFEAGGTNRNVGSMRTISQNGSILVNSSGSSIQAINLNTAATNTFQISVSKTVVSFDGNIISFEGRLSGTGKVVVGYVDLATGATNLITKGIGATGADDDSGAPAVSADGRFIAFESWAANLVANDTNGMKDVFLYDRQKNELRVAGAGNGATFNPSFNGEASALFFLSAASDLNSADGDDIVDLFAVQLEQEIEIEFQGIELLQGGMRRLRWVGLESATGVRVEFKEQLSDADWTDLGAAISQENGEWVVTDGAVAGQRFYRVRLGP